MPKLKPTCPRNNRKLAGVHGIISVGGKVEELWRKGFVEKMCFKPGVEERRSNGRWQWWWRIWRTDMRSDKNDKSSWWVAKFLGKLIPETGWCVTERAVVDLRQEEENWARQGYNIWRTSATLCLASIKTCLTAVVFLRFWHRLQMLPLTYLLTYLKLQILKLLRIIVLRQIVPQRAYKTPALHRPPANSANWSLAAEDGRFYLCNVRCQEHHLPASELSNLITILKASYCYPL